MSSVEREEAFDATTRERIRLRILDYKKEHRLGVGRLAKRIAQANPNEPIIPVKTLQRFLTGRTRTSDMYVKYFDRFACGLPDADPVGELGKCMAALYRTTGDNLPGFEYSGEFTVRSSSQNDLSEMTIVPDGAFWRLVERTCSDGHLMFDGVMVHAGTAFIAALKDRLWGLPKFYMLQHEAEGLSGRGCYVEFNGNQNFPQVRLIGRNDV